MLFLLKVIKAMLTSGLTYKNPCSTQLMDLYYP